MELFYELPNEIQLKLLETYPSLIQNSSRVSQHLRQLTASSYYKLFCTYVITFRELIMFIKYRGTHFVLYNSDYDSFIFYHRLGRTDKFASLSLYITNTINYNHSSPQYSIYYNNIYNKLIIEAHKHYIPDLYSYYLVLQRRYRCSQIDSSYSPKSYILSQFQQTITLLSGMKLWCYLTAQLYSFNVIHQITPKTFLSYANIPDYIHQTSNLIITLIEQLE